MKIRKFYEFIKEEVLNDPPQIYIKSKLEILQNVFNKMFDVADVEELEDEENSIKKAKDTGKRKEDDEKLLSGFLLTDNNISLFSQLFDSLTVKFEDDLYEYHLIIQIPSSEATPKDPNKNISLDDIKNCLITFKKYDKNTNEGLGSLPKQEFEIEKVNAELIIKLINDLDKNFGSKDDEFKIETND
jgi:hypothetical protein